MLITIELRKLLIRSERSHNCFLILELGTAQPTDDQKNLQTLFEFPVTLPQKHRDDLQSILEDALFFKFHLRNQCWKQKNGLVSG